MGLGVLVGARVGKAAVATWTGKFVGVTTGAAAPLAAIVDELYAVEPGVTDPVAVGGTIVIMPRTTASIVRSGVGWSSGVGSVWALALPPQLLIQTAPTSKPPRSQTQVAL